MTRRFWVISITIVIVLALGVVLTWRNTNKEHGRLQQRHSKPAVKKQEPAPPLDSATVQSSTTRTVAATVKSVYRAASDDCWIVTTVTASELGEMAWRVSPSNREALATYMDAVARKKVVIFTLQKIDGANMYISGNPTIVDQ